MFIATGTPAELVTPAGYAVSQMRPEVLSGLNVSINMQPLTGLGIRSGEVRCREGSTQLEVIQVFLLLTTKTTVTWPCFALYYVLV